MSTISSSSKDNLIQNFYIIGFSPEDFFKLNQSRKTGLYEDIFKEQIKDISILSPKIITKYPNNKKNINSIIDEVIVDHCFPKGIIEIYQRPANDCIKKYFQFELDNIPQNYPNDEQNIFSKIYFSCLEFGESISDYYKYRREIFNTASSLFKIENYDKNEIGGEDIEKKYFNLLIPKVICFASVKPFYNELTTLLDCIYNFYLSKEVFPPFAMENLIEQIVNNIPIPLQTENQISIEIKTNISDKVIFPLNYISELHINSSANMPLVDIFKYFSIEDIVLIFKYIIYEIPILFFSNDKLILSLFIDTFLSVLSPFKYVYPHISILPKKLYGLINMDHFIFGINENYTEEFFHNNRINLDKTIIIINIEVDEIKKTGVGKIKEKIYDFNKTQYILGKTESDDFITFNQNKTSILGVDIPNILKKKLIDGIYQFISFHKRKNLFNNKDSKAMKDITIKTQYAFFSFFVNVMDGYTDYLLKPISFYSDPKNIGDNVYFKNDDYFLKQVFNSQEFIKNQKDCQLFYSIFLKTKMVFNFFHERIYNDNIIDQLIIRQFDQLTVLKKHQDLRKKKENKILYENFKKGLLPEKKKKTVVDNIILNDFSSNNNNDVKIFVNNIEKNVHILIKYIQLFSLEKDNYSKRLYYKSRESIYESGKEKIQVRYYLFPKLLFDFPDVKQIEHKHPYQTLGEFKSNCKKEYEKITPDIFDKYHLEKRILPNSGKINYQVSQDIYVKYIWLILLSCSLWYCEPEEKNHRQEKLFEVLFEIDHFETYILNIVFINIYKYGGKYYLIKLYKIYKEIIGYTNYYLTYLLCNKIRQKEEDDIKDAYDINADEGEQNDLKLRKRYLIKLNDEFSQKRRKKLDKNSDDNEEIIFSSEQICKECQEESNVDIKKLLAEKKDLNINNYSFICSKCKKENKSIIIKYQILLFNCVNKEIFVTKTGEFVFSSPYKLYCNLKNYLAEQNNDKLEISYISNIEDKLGLMNIFFFFFLSNLSFDYLLPYVPIKSSNMKLFLDQAEAQHIEEQKPIKISYKNEVIFRKFNYIKPILNLKKKASLSLFGFEFGKKTVETDLSFTIKSTKKSKK